MRWGLVERAESSLIEQWQSTQRRGDAPPSASGLVEFLIEANMSLLVRTTWRRARQLDRADLEQAARVGLLEALRRFRTGRGAPFGPYAITWIRKEQQRTVASGDHPIAVPPHRLGDLAAVRHATQSPAQTDAEIAAALELSPQAVAGLRQVLAITPPTHLADHAHKADIIGEAEMRLTIEAALSKMPARTAEIVRLRYGLHDGEPRTLRKIAANLGVSDHTVRSELARAHRHLARHLA